MQYRIAFIACVAIFTGLGSSAVLKEYPDDKPRIGADDIIKDLADITKDLVKSETFVAEWKNDVTQAFTFKRFADKVAEKIQDCTGDINHLELLNEDDSKKVLEQFAITKQASMNLMEKVAKKQNMHKSVFSSKIKHELPKIKDTTSSFCKALNEKIPKEMRSKLKKDCDQVEKTAEATCKGL